VGRQWPVGMSPRQLARAHALVDGLGVVGERVSVSPAQGDGSVRVATQVAYQHVSFIVDDAGRVTSCAAEPV
jgi:hypothetical protein